MRKYRENVKSNHGITLIALVVTIIILIILALISINAVFGENGLVKRAEQAAEKQAAAKFEEELKIKLLDAQIGSITEGDNSFLNELFGEKIKGEYREKWTYGENFEIEIDAIIEDEGKYFRCDIIINDSIDVRNTKQVNEVDPMPEALYKFRENSNDIEIINESESITEIKYQETNYNVIEMSLDRNTDIIYIEPVESAKKWKNVFTAWSEAIAVDTENNVWMWQSSRGNINGWDTDINDIQPVCISSACPILKTIEIQDIITYSGYRISGVVSNEGKIYFFGEETSLNDLYPEQLENVWIKEAINKNIMLDKNNIIWNIEYGENTITVKNINELSGLSDISFQKIKLTEYYSSGYKDAIIGLDTNKNIWEIKLDNSEIIEVRCLTNISTEPLYNKEIKDITLLDKWSSEIMILGEDNHLYEYDVSENNIIDLSNRDDVKNIEIDEYCEGIALDKNSDIWEFLEYETVFQLNTEGRYNNEKMKMIYPNKYTLDINNNFWRKEYVGDSDVYSYETVLSLTGKTINKVSSNSVIMVIDSDGNLYKHGVFYADD